MSIPINTIVKIAQAILLPDTQTAINVFWATLDDNVGGGPLDEDDVLEAAANWMDQLYGNITTEITTQVASTLIDLWTVDAPTGDLTPVGDEATTWNGAAAADMMPNGCAAIVALKTVDTDVTGRKFIPGYAETIVTDNNLNGAALTGLATFGVDWATQYVDPNDVILDPGVYSSAKNAFFDAGGTIIANAIVGYQRRRKPGVGS